MTHAEDVKRVWADSQRMKRALLLAREAGKQLEVIRREQDERERQTQIELKPKEKK